MTEGTDGDELECAQHLSPDPVSPTEATSEALEVDALTPSSKGTAPEESKGKRKSAYRRKAEAEIESKRFYNDLKDELYILERMSWTEKRWREESKLEKGRAILQELQRGLPRVLDQLGLRFKEHSPCLERVEKAALAARQRGDHDLLRSLRVYCDDCEFDNTRTDWHTLFEVQRQFCALPAFRATKYLEPSSIRHPLRCAEVLNRSLFKKGRYIGGARILSEIRFPQDDEDDEDDEDCGAKRQELRQQLLEELRGQCVAGDQSIEEAFDVQIQLVIRSGGSEFIWMPGYEVRLHLDDRVYFEQSHVWSEEKRCKLYHTGRSSHEMRRRLKAFERLLTGGIDDRVCEEDFEFVEMTARTDGGVANGVPEFLGHSVTGGIEHAEKVFERCGKAKGWSQRPKALYLRELFGTNLAGYRRQQGREIQWAPGPELYWACGDRPLRLLRMAHEPIRVRFRRGEEPYGFHLHDLRGGNGGVEVIEVVPLSVADSRGIVVGRTVKRLLYGGRVENVQNWSRAAIQAALQKMPENFTIEFGKGDTEERHHAPLADAEMATLMEERFMRGFLHEVADARADDIQPTNRSYFDSDGWSNVFPDLGPTLQPSLAHQAFVLSETTIQAVMGAAHQNRFPQKSSQKEKGTSRTVTWDDFDPCKRQSAMKEQNEMELAPTNEEEVESNLKEEHQCELNRGHTNANEKDLISASPPTSAVSWMWSMWSMPADEDTGTKCADKPSAQQQEVIEGENKNKEKVNLSDHVHGVHVQEDKECIAELDHVMHSVGSVEQESEQRRITPAETDLSQFSSGPFSWVCSVWGNQEHAGTGGTLSEKDHMLLQEISAVLAEKEQEPFSSPACDTRYMPPVLSTTQMPGLPEYDGWHMGGVTGHPMMAQGQPAHTVPWLWCPTRLPEPSWVTTATESTATHGLQKDGCMPDSHSSFTAAQGTALPEKLGSHMCTDANFLPSPEALVKMYAQAHGCQVPIHSSPGIRSGAFQLDAFSSWGMQSEASDCNREANTTIQDCSGTVSPKGAGLAFHSASDGSSQAQLHSSNPASEVRSTTDDSTVSRVLSVFDFSKAFTWESAGNEIQQPKEDHGRQGSPMRVPLHQATRSLPAVAELLHAVGTPPGLDLPAKASPCHKSVTGISFAREGSNASLSNMVPADSASAASGNIDASAALEHTSVGKRPPTSWSSGCARNRPSKKSSKNA